jgi:hypothetical protein
MKKIILLLMVLLFAKSYFNLYAQTPVPLADVVGDTLPYNPAHLWYQMLNPGSNSVTSQNFESSLNIYDSFAADRFGIMDDFWSVTKVEVRGVYYGGSGTAGSVNVWFYNDSSGYPGQIIHSSLNIIPTNGLSSGSFSIPLSLPVELMEGMYWICVQANMNFDSSGQWGWTTSNDYFFNESVWKNPGGGFGSVCTNWNYRASNCGIGTSPGLCFSLIGDIIPVELISFEASVIDNDVALNWTTATETNNQGFGIERLQDSMIEKIEDWVKIGFVNGNGTTTEPQAYSFVDEKLSAGKYQYRLKQIDFDGSFEYSNIIEVDISLPAEFSLEQNYPNPFNPSTSIQYAISSRQFVQLKVYDVLGNEIATLVNEEKPAGSYEVMFNPESSIRHPASEVYFYQLKAGNYLETRKMILIK